MELKWCGDVYGKTPLNNIYQYILIVKDYREIEIMKKGTITVLFLISKFSLNFH